MRPPIDRNDDRPVAIPLAARPGVAPWKIAAGLIALVSLGILGRLVPPPTPAAPESRALTTAAPSPEQVVRLGSPFADVLYVRTTEIAVRGTAPAGIDQVDVDVVVFGQSIGEERIAVDARGRFDGLVSITPPATRAVGVLRVREPSSARLLAELSFAVQAGALVLPWQPSKLLGEAGSTMVVDVLVYGPLREIRALLTTVDGKLIATGSALVGTPRRTGASGPWTIGVSIEMPPDRLPDRARLHVMAFDQSGAEVEHLDANVALSNG